MSKKILIDAFFTQFTSFLEELKEMYPSDPDFPMFLMTLSMMKSTNPMLVLTYVNTEIISVYGSKIAERDETFFMNQDFKNHGDVDLDILQKLKQYISTMTPASKDMVWKYIDIITRLCVKALDV